MCTPKFKTIPIVAMLAQLGCTAPGNDQEASHAWYDEPHQIPVGVPFVNEQVDDSPQVLATPEDCKRGRGIDGDGNCVPLVSREQEFGGMVQLPTGAFLRGDIPPRYDAKRSGTAGEKPPHVTLPGQPMLEDHSPGFWMDGYEVSRKAYAKCVEAGRCTPATCVDGSDGRPTDRQLGDLDLGAFPQTCVTHEQAQNYCEQRGVRLPTEGEWEYAARGPEAWMYPWGHQLRDEIGIALGPVGFDPGDISYFGLKGFGGNAMEWVADPFDPDANISRYLAGPFRSDDGPIGRAWTAWIEQLCGGQVCELGKRYVVKGGRSGSRSGAWQLAEGQTLTTVPTENFEGDPTVAQHERLGFRCAADLEPGQVPLTIPKAPYPLPLVHRGDEYDTFLGIAEAVNREEAARFCSLIVAPGDAKPVSPDSPLDNGWRLPTLEEINAVNDDGVGAVEEWFGGPGPFWTADGAAEKIEIDSETPLWELIAADDAEPLMARCIRDKR
jgi:formylglycine-generating enzyme required for sulfatase activity